MGKTTEKDPGCNKPEFFKEKTIYLMELDGEEQSTWDAIQLKCLKVDVSPDCLF